MKIRTAFVSNSSSSSFIIAFEKKPESVSELQHLLFGNELEFPNPYPGGKSPNSYLASEIAEIVFKDIKDSLNYEQLVDEIESGWFDGGFYTENDMHDFCKNEDGTTDYKRYAEMRLKEARNVADRFKLRWPHREFYVVEYSDNDGDRASAIEHGDLFALIPHIRVSKH